MASGQENLVGRIKAMTAVEMGSEDDPTEAKRLQEMRKGWSLPRDHALDFGGDGMGGDLKRNAYNTSI